MAASSSGSSSLAGASHAAASDGASGKPRTSGITATSDVVDIPAFEKLRQEMSAEDAVRETVIKRSRDVLKLSKTAIYCLHRKQMDLAEHNAAEAQSIATEELLPLVASLPQLRWGGALSGALEEYAEARVFQIYLATGKVPGPSAPGLGGVVNRDEFLGGLMDFVGELTRVTVLAATARDEAAVSRGREVVEDIQMALMGFDFRNGQLRRKFDALKYSLKKIEQITYELSLTKALGGFAMDSRGMDAGAADGDGEDEAEDQGGSGGGRGGGGGGRGGGGGGRGRGRGGGSGKRLEGMGRGRKGAAVQASIAGASAAAESSPGAKRPKAAAGPA